MKFRPVRELLSEAMAEVKEIAATKEALAGVLNERESLTKVTPEQITLEHGSYDERIGWDTYYVLVDGRASGYTDGPLR